MHETVLKWLLPYSCNFLLQQYKVHKNHVIIYEVVYSELSFKKILGDVV